MERLSSAFRNCEKLQNHMQLLLDKGGLYKTYNGNLLFHGSIPLNEDGTLKEVEIYGETCKGKALYDKLEAYVRKAFFTVDEKEQKDSQNIYLGELDYEALMSCVEGELRYKPLSPYAAVKRDLALVCDEAVACGDIEETIRKASPLITEVKLFDIYRGANLGEGKKSMAFSLTLSDPAAEVSNEQVERTVKKVLGNLKFKLGIEIR